MSNDKSYTQKVAGIGFFGGLFVSILSYVAHFFHFTKVGPAIAMDPWALAEWKSTYLGHIAGILFISIISLGLTLLVRAALQEIESIWPGLCFGLILWLIVFYLLHPVFPNLPPVERLGSATITTTICLFVLYGIFIGYSISYEYNEIKRERDHSTQK
ncbi:YqhR family membrane protein [Alteribacillus sp. HJP-4]|uniref:YqhR family membrane protein n=1 Tax=Alteribacillus sp. HJP-4 TaxID=2775394 RepID=UPI0035CCE068